MAFEKAKIYVDRGNGYNESVDVLFNPEKYSVNSSVKYDEKEQQNLGKDPSTLNVTLFFDTYEAGFSVRYFTDKILGLMELNSDGIPPMCKFVWGNFVFEGVVKNVTQKFTMFLENGVPVRADITVQMTSSTKVVGDDTEVTTKEVELSGSDIGTDDLEEKYFSFYAPVFSISVGEVNLKSSGMLINSVTVESHTEKADSFFFKIVNAYDEKKKDVRWIEDTIVPGKDVVINMGYGTSTETIFKGTVTSVEAAFTGDKTVELNVSGMDVSYKLMKGTRSKSWTSKKHSDVVKEIASGCGMDCEADETEVTYEIIEQSMISDYRFLVWMAEKNNFEFFVTGKKLYFRKPYKNKKPVVKLEWGKRFKSLEIGFDIADQTGDITVRGWDEKKKEEIEGKSSDIDKLNESGKTGQAIMKEAYSAIPCEYIYTAVESKDEAEKLATAELNKRARKMVRGKGETVGMPEIRAGRYMEISGIGNKLSKLYYIVSAKHVMDEKEYKTSFTLGGNTF